MAGPGTDFGIGSDQSNLLISAWAALFETQTLALTNVAASSNRSSRCTAALRSMPRLFKRSRPNSSRTEFEEELPRLEDSLNVEMSVGRVTVSVFGEGLVDVVF